MAGCGHHEILHINREVGEFAKGRRSARLIKKDDGPSHRDAPRNAIIYDRWRGELHAFVENLDIAMRLNRVVCAVVIHLVGDKERADKVLAILR